MTSRSQSLAGLAGLALAIVLLSQISGCDSNALQKDLGDAVKSMQDTVSTATGTETGSIALSLDPPVELETGYVRFTPPGHGRPGALQFTSYKEPSEESFPSMYVRVETDVRLAEELAGQSVPATIFVQRNSNGDLWRSDPDEQPQVNIVSATSSLVTCEISEARLIRAGSDQAVTVSGRITGVRH